MKEVTVDKENVLSRLRENRTQHEQDYRDALQGWKETVLEHLERLRAQLEEQPEKVVPLIPHPRPESHLEEYDRMIEMLELHLPTSITITQDEFRAYYQDDWDWKSRFDTANVNYLGKVRK